MREQPVPRPCVQRAARGRVAGVEEVGGTEGEQVRAVMRQGTGSSGLQRLWDRLCFCSRIGFGQREHGLTFQQDHSGR